MIKNACLFLALFQFGAAAHLPQVVSLWDYTSPGDAAWNELKFRNGTAVSSVVVGVENCELNGCNLVGYGQSEDEVGGSSLDACIFDGATLKAGCVGNLKLIKRAIRVAYFVLCHTWHTLLVGDEATDFAASFGLERESLSSPNTIADYQSWHANRCQFNYRKKVWPDACSSCGPYSRVPSDPFDLAPFRHPHNPFVFCKDSAEVPPQQTVPEISGTVPPYDSFGLICLDSHGNVAAGVSAAGKNHRIPGRVGDYAQAGASSYASNDVGAAITTGDGDVLCRFTAASLAVAFLELGFSASDAAQKVIDKINKWYPNIGAGIVVVGINGDVGAACSGFKELPYVVSKGDSRDTVTFRIPCSTYCV